MIDITTGCDFVMRLPSVPTLPMVEHLNTTYFHRVWNAPTDHGRANFQLYKASQRVSTGSVPVDLSVVGLPTTDVVYAVYRVASHVFGRFVSFPENVWIHDADIFADFGVSMISFAASGRVLPTGQIWLRYDPLRQIVLVAVSVAYTQSCIGLLYPDLYMTVYKDTTRTTPIKSQTLQVSTAFGAVITAATVTAVITAAKTSYPNGTIVAVNGFLYDPVNVPALNTGDVVEITSDPDIIGYCDLTIDDNTTGYQSILRGEYREALHIPKSLNPNDYVITHDTLTLVAFDSTTHKGVYLHRVDLHAVLSITHNDFSVSRSILNAFETALGAQGITVRVYVRYATHPHALGGDVNRIADLYTLGDDEIKKQLVGLSTHQIPEWNAASLEQSAYLHLLYQFTGFTSANIISNYTSAMGYYDVASVLGESMHYHTYQGAQLSVRKPARLIGYPCCVIVYANGRKVPDSYINLAYDNGGSFLLGFKSGGYIATGTRLGIYVTEGAVEAPVAFNPTSATPALILPNDDYSLFKIVSYETPQIIWSGTTSIGYHYIPVSPGDYETTINTDGTATYELKPVHYGDSFYLVPNTGITTSVYPLDTLLANKQPLLFPLQMTDSTGLLLPLIGYGALEVYINGYRLLENVDYTCQPVMGTHDDVLQTFLVISNEDYLNVSGTGNILEVITHGDVSASHDIGYVISNTFHRSVPPMVWSKTQGRAFAHGLLIEHVTEAGNTVTTTDSVADGAPYLLEWNLPYSVAKVMGPVSEHATLDIELRTRIDRVLNLVAPTYPPFVILNQLYALYSPFLMAIVKDVATGAFTIVNDPEDNLFLNQFMKYDLIYKRDPTLGDSNPLINRNYVTLSAGYENSPVQDATQMLLVQRLITLLLTPGQLSIEEVLL